MHNQVIEELCLKQIELSVLRSLAASYLCLFEYGLSCSQYTPGFVVIPLSGFEYHRSTLNHVELAVRPSGNVC